MTIDDAIDAIGAMVSLAALALLVVWFSLML